MRSRTSCGPSTRSLPQASARPPVTVERCLEDCLETLYTQAESALTGYRIMVRHLVELIGNIQLTEPKVRGRRPRSWQAGEAPVDPER
jgi:hypothetical protein